MCRIGKERGEYKALWTSVPPCRFMIHTLLQSAFGDNQLHHGSLAQVTCIVAASDHLQATQDLVFKVRKTSFLNNEVLVCKLRIIVLLATQNLTFKLRKTSLLNYTKPRFSTKQDLALKLSKTSFLNYVSPRLYCGLVLASFTYSSGGSQRENQFFGDCLYFCKLKRTAIKKMRKIPRLPIPGNHPVCDASRTGVGFTASRDQVYLW